MSTTALLDSAIISPGAAQAPARIGGQVVGLAAATRPPLRTSHEAALADNAPGIPSLPLF